MTDIGGMTGSLNGVGGGAGGAWTRPGCVLVRWEVCVVEVRDWREGMLRGSVRVRREGRWAGPVFVVDDDDDDVIVDVDVDVAAEDGVINWGDVDGDPAVFGKYNKDVFVLVL